jgi:hypothetical protein
VRRILRHVCGQEKFLLTETEGNLLRWRINHFPENNACPCAIWACGEIAKNAKIAKKSKLEYKHSALSRRQSATGKKAGNQPKMQATSPCVGSTQKQIEREGK